VKKNVTIVGPEFITDSIELNFLPDAAKYHPSTAISSSVDTSNSKRRKLIEGESTESSPTPATPAPVANSQTAPSLKQKQKELFGKWRTARVFISSTFRDMHGERDYLTKVVFPELQDRCALSLISNSVEFKQHFFCL